MLKNILFILVLFVPYFVFSQGDFFQGYQEADPFVDNPNKEESAQKNEPINTDNIKQTSQEIDGSIILGDRVKVRVNNLILTQRQLSIFFGLRKLSSFLNKLDNPDDLEKEMILVLGLEAFAKANNLYNLLPTSNEMDKRIDFLNNNTKSQTLSETVLKIDPSGNLTQKDMREFLYYQILREKGFVYALQQDFLPKMFSPRDDEILLLYKQVLLSDSRIFQTPDQLYVMNITAVEPANDQKKKKLIQDLEKVKKSMEEETDINKREKIFVSAINKYSSSHLRNTNVIGPLDETLINQDFPEYKDLFLLKAGGVSSVIDQDGFIRLIFAKKKDTGELKSVDNPDIRQKIIGIIYDTKGNILFHSFLQENLNNFDVEIMDK